MKLDKIILSVRKTIKFRMMLFFIIILSILTYSPPILAQETNNDIDYKAIIDSLEYNDTELWEGLYYGIIKELIPIYEEPYDMNLRKWNSVDEIYKGILTLKLISNLNPTLPSLYEKILSNKTRNVIVQKLFELRSDLSDLWWHNFDESVLAYSSLIELKVTNITLNELNLILNNGLSLNSYFENIAYEKIEENQSLQPNWKNITLFDILEFRMNDFSSYQKILLDPYSLEMKFENVILAQAENLVTLHDLGLNTKVNQKVIDNKDKLIREKIVNNEINQFFNYIKSYYTAFYDETCENEENLLQINTTKMIDQYPEIFLSNDYNFNGLSNFNTPMRLSVTISNMTNLLVSKKLFDAGLIYYTQFDTKSYEVSTPNDHWDMDENGSLIFVHEILNETHNVLLPANGTWINEYTYIPENETAYGEFIWNITIMDQPQSYKVYLEIESQKYKMTQNGEGSQEFIDF
jgi:hypothetical protein